MAGHSKWANTKHRKAAVDSKRGKLFSVLSKELTIAAKSGGGDPGFNPRLRTCILKAKTVNMPNDNIDRAIKKGTGELPGVSYEEIAYEGYGPSGIAIIVTTTTDNKNRTVSEVRSTLTKFGGNLASPGALAFNFQRRGQFLINASQTSEEQLMEIALEGGAEDILNHNDHFEVLCNVSEFDTLSDTLEKAGIKPDTSEIAYIPSTTVPVTDADLAKRLLKLIDTLEELDDVNHVFANFDMDDQLLEA